MEKESSDCSKSLAYADDSKPRAHLAVSALRRELRSLSNRGLVHLGAATCMVLSCLIWSFHQVGLYTDLVPSYFRRSAAPSASRGLIPRNLIFTYAYNVFEKKKPKRIYANVQHTIAAYTEAWGNSSDINVWFIDDAECDEIIRQVEPRLLPHFHSEGNGAFKGDICRACALALKGGYYFDIDVQVVVPFLLPDTVSFSTCISEDSGFKSTFFQAFMASAPNDTIVVQSIEYMLRHYNKSDEGMHCPLVGPSCLYRAYMDLNHTLPAESSKFLTEINIEGGRYPDVPLLVGEGDYCNYGVEDAEAKVFHFFSRLVGTKGCPRTQCDEWGCTRIIFWNDD